MDRFRHYLIFLFLIVIIIASFDWGPVVNGIMPVLTVITLFIASWLHGLERYGWKNMGVFFGITFFVSLFFEALSIQTGFPFGHYYYDKLIGPRLFQVPLIIMFAYFSMAYLSWTLSQILLKFKNRTFIVPFVATFIMVMWDLCMDPLSSTVASLWVWPSGGAYYGVPHQNYFGWFLCVYTIFQLFAFYIFTNESYYAAPKKFWREAIFLYGIQALVQLISPFTIATNRDIYGPMALITLFTMVFVALISYVTLEEQT